MSEIVGTIPKAEPVKAQPKPAPRSVPSRDGLAKFAKSVNKRFK